MSALEVRSAGIATTAQDLGLRGHAHLGVSRGGALDTRSHASANLAVGNAPNAIALEVTLQGPTLVVRAPCTVAWCGAPFDVDVDGAPVPPVRARPLAPGQVLRVGRCASGARGALAFAGGVALARGTALAVGATFALGGAREGTASTPSPPLLGDGPVTLRVTDGVHTARFPAASRVALVRASFVVDPAADRRGVRLRGPPLAVPPGDVVSVGVSVGAVQVTPSGQVVVLGVDRATTGGYPILAHVIRADAWLLGQLRPGAELCFAQVGFDEARRIWLTGDRCG